MVFYTSYCMDAQTKIRWVTQRSLIAFYFIHSAQRKTRMKTIHAGMSVLNLAKKIELGINLVISAKQ